METNSEDERYIKLDRDINRKLIEETGEPNSKYILAYDKQGKLDRKTIATTSTNKQKLHILFSRYIKRDWKTITKEDMEKIVTDIDNDTNFSEKTKSNYKKMFKQLDRFLNKGECSASTDWIKTTPLKRKLNTLSRSDLLTDEEKKKLIRSCDNKRDKALISIWLETGLRPKELRVLTIGCITTDKDICYIEVPDDTKTGKRTVPIYFSKPALLDYLNEHPAKDNSNAPLWVKLTKSRFLGYQTKIEPMNNKGYEDLLKRISARADIKKRVYWYLGRHNSYTDKVANGWNEGIIKQFHGIEAGSTVLNRYVHLSPKDVTNKVREYYGLEIRRRKEPELTITTCINCGTENSTTEMRCVKCGYIIDKKLMAEELAKKQEVESRLKKVESIICTEAFKEALQTYKKLKSGEKPKLKVRT